jgi:tetratricopeptide (TPR) repeat protein
MNSRLVPLGLGLFAISCATTGVHEQTGVVPPVPNITSDEDYGAARADYTALPVGHGRVGWRNALLTYLLPRIDELLAKQSDDAVEVFKSACALYDPDELAKPGGPAEIGKVGEKIAQTYSMRGAEEPVVLGLSVAASFDPGAQKRWEERLKWIDDFESSGGGPGRRWTKVIESLEATARVWPSPLVVDRLAQLYIERHDALVKALRKGPSGGAADLIEGQDAGATHTAYKLAAAVLRSGRLGRAQELLGKIADQPGDDPSLRNLLTRAARPKKPDDLVDLAKYFVREDAQDREVALGICMQATLKFPKDTESRVCAAEMAVSTSALRLPLAIKLMTEVVALSPSERPPAEMLAKLRFLRLQSRFGEERARVEQAAPEAEDLVKFIDAKQTQLGGKPFDPDGAEVLLELANAFYNTGSATEAASLLKRSIDRHATWKAFHQEGLLALKHGQNTEALADFDRALSAERSSMQETLEARSSVLRDKGEALDRLGKAESARTAREQALESWMQLLALMQHPPDAARAEVERGRLLYELGKPREAVEAFDKAMEFAPARAETYADVIAFLVARGHLSEALDAYHRALGRNDISDYIKVYSSLWVVDLAERQHDSPDPLAVQFLKNVTGNRWYDDLARWQSGRMTWQQLITKADTPNKQAEAYFYQAQKLLVEGKEAQARELWRKVLSTDMMAFFEFDMAEYYLRKGPPKKVAPIPPPEQHPSKPTDSI